MRVEARTHVPMKGLDGSNPPLSASQSAMFAFSAEKSKILRMLAHFLLLKGTGEVQILLSVADLWSILSVAGGAGALRAIVCRDCSPRHRAFAAASPDAGSWSLARCYRGWHGHA